MGFRDIDPNERPPRRNRPLRVTDTDGWSPVGAAGRGLGAWHIRRGSRLTLDPVQIWGGGHEQVGEVPQRYVDALVIGAGQAGLSAAYQLEKAGFRGFAPALGRDSTGRHSETPTYVVLDDEDGPGGAWQHRWDTLTMGTVNHIGDLPGMRMEPADSSELARVAVTRYFTEYEDAFDLAILRPVRVYSIERVDDDADSHLRVLTNAGVFYARAVISATGTWGRPFWPHVPGRETFQGRQLHTRDYDGVYEFVGSRVIVVGGGISAVGHVLDISEVARVRWYTRRPPEFRTGPFTEGVGREVEEAVRANIARGERPKSVVSYTGLPVTPAVRRGIDSGVLRARPMFHRIEPRGVRGGDGSFTEADVILWATGFRQDLHYLRGLRVRTARGGLRLSGTQLTDEPRVFLVGLGADSSTVGARRSAREAVGVIARRLGIADGDDTPDS